MKPENIFILIGCEESQAIALAFRALGYQAFSCDLKPCSGGRPDIHLQMDLFEAMKIRKWDFFMVHPVCKYVAVSGLHWNGRVEGRAEKTEQALQFICDILNAALLYEINHIGMENPVGCISTRIMFLNKKYVVIPLKDKKLYSKKSFKPTQTIQPYQFYEDASKATCLWLIGLPPLSSTKRYPGRWVNGVERWANQTDSGQNNLGPSDDRDELRSKTYPGIAKAMAEQWGDYILTHDIL